MHPSDLVLLGLLATASVCSAVISNADTITQKEAIDYLKQWRPQQDGVTEEFLRGNADLAMETQQLPYAKQVSREMFLSYVLPYAHFDEPRDDWRPRMYQTLLPLVKDKQTLQEAADALFPAWWQKFGKSLVFKPNQTPQLMAPFSQTFEKGYASCTGMSIFLADCMRAVGIPARIVGVNVWNRPERGNHNWVEVWMGDHWSFVDAVPLGGAAEWNKTWFNDQAKKQVSSSEFAIMSPLWGPQATSVYNMTWKPEEKDKHVIPAIDAQTVPAIDVTANYAENKLAMISWHSERTSSWHSAGIVVIMLVVTLIGGVCGLKYERTKDGYERMS